MADERRRRSLLPNVWDIASVLLPDDESFVLVLGLAADRFDEAIGAITGLDHLVADEPQVLRVDIPVVRVVVHEKDAEMSCGGIR